MKKRGQVYLIAAMVICLVLFILLTGTNIFRKIVVKDRFEDVAKNYEIEISKYINEVVKSGEVTSDDLRGFTSSFINKYSNDVDSEIGMLYVFAYSDGFWIYNYLAEDNNDEYVVVNYQGLIDNTPSCDTSSYTCGIFCMNVPSIRFKPNSCGLLELTGTGNLFLTIKDVRYGPFENSDVENPTLVFIFKKAKDSTVKVFINDKGKGKSAEVKV